MANARPPSNAGGTPLLRLGIDVARLRSDTSQITQSFRDMSRDTVQIAREQSRQVTTLLRAQQAQISADARAQSQVRVQQARAESIAQQQAARTASQVAIQEERRKTAAFNAEIRQRQRAQAQQGSVGQGAAAFAGAAFGGPIGGVAGALAGGPAGAALAAGLVTREVVNQGAQAVRAASDLTESINKTGVAFAGSQRQILSWSENSARALGQSRQQALEAASSFGLLFRTIGLGSGESAKMSQGLVQLAADLASINNIPVDDALTKLRAGLVGEVEPLRTVGVLLNAQVVAQKAVDLGLASTTSAVSEQAKVLARYQLILEQTTLQQGDFARTSGELANQQRIAAAQWTDFRTALGQPLQPAVTLGLQVINAFLSEQARQLKQLTQDWDDLNRAILRAGGANVLTGMQERFVTSPTLFDDSQTGISARTRAANGPALDTDQIAALRRRDEGFAAIERQATRSRLDESRSYNRQIASIESSYQKSTLREAQDFARQRLNAERKLGLAILDVAQDSARERVQWEAETERTIAEARGKTVERIADIEEKYNRDAERRAADHADKLIDAAGRLDAKAVAEEQRRFAREREDAQDARDEQVAEARESLQEQIDDQRDALQRRIEEQRANDARRIEDMKAAFEEQKAQEDIERGIRLARQAEDHNDQLGELARQHSERIQQIKDQAADERTQWTEESNKFLEAVNIHNQAWLDEQRRINDGVLQRHEELLFAQRQALLVPGHPSLADPYADRETPYPYAPPVAPLGGGGNSTRTVTISQGAIQIYATPNQSPYDIGMEVEKTMERLLRGVVEQ